MVSTQRILEGIVYWNILIRVLLVRFRLMTMGYMIWQETSGSGVGIAFLNRMLGGRTRKDQPYQIFPVFYVEELGTTTLTYVGQQPVTV